MFSRQTNSRHSIYVMDNLAAQVENGLYLSSGMKRFPKIFSDFAVNIVHVGEISGTLNENLNYLAEELKKKQELKRKIISALIYPVFIVFATLGVIILLTAYVFPKIMPIFKSFKFQLPWTTRALIFMSNLFIHYGMFILGGLLICAASAVLLLKVEKIKYAVDKNLLRLPLFGTLLKSYYMANSARTLGLLLKSDVRIVQALAIVADTTGNVAYKQEFAGLMEYSIKGGKMSDYMLPRALFFPPMLSQMVSVGEATGSLSNTLMYLSEIYEDEMNTLTKNLSNSIEPALMICMGLLVGFIALSIITPIYGVTQNIHP